MLRPQDDLNVFLEYNSDIEDILESLWLRYNEIREFGTRFRYHKAAASLKSTLNKNYNSLKDYTIKAVAVVVVILTTISIYLSTYTRPM